MSLDYPTMMFFSSLVSILIVILFLCFIIFTKNHKLNIILFTLGRGLIAIGVIGIALRGNIPDFVSLTVSNVFILSGTGSTILGVISYNKTVHKDMFLIFAFFIVAASFLYMLFIDSYTYRSIIIYLAIGIMTFMGSVNLYLSRESFKFPIFISVVLLIYALGRMVFAFQHLGLPDDFNILKDDTTSQLFVPFFSILSLGIAVGFLLLLREVDVCLIQDKNHELRRLNANKDKLLSIIAHDLKSPFNGILGFSEVLVESSKEDSIEEIQGYATRINKEAQKAFESLNDLLEWVLSNSDNITPSIKKHLLSSFVDEIMMEFTPRVKEKKIKLNKELPENRSCSFDKNMIGSLLRNLLSNAIKFSPDNKNITIKAKLSDNNLTIAVIDQGIGIEKDMLKRIFSPDSKVSTPGTRGELGSGLGLSICKELIQKHSGELWAESTIGIGSSFTFSIPQNKA